MYQRLIYYNHYVITILTINIFQDVETSWTKEPLYEGSKWKVEDLLIILEMFKVTGKMGDGLENCMLGLIASILPPSNVISAQLNDTSKSNYFFQKTIKTGHQQFRKMRVLQISCCRNGCCAFMYSMVVYGIVFSL